MHGYRLIAIMFAALAAGLDALSMWMMHLSGVTQGATESGQWALGNASMAVHLGLAVCGLAMFISRNWLVSIICGVMMMAGAACSAWQIAGFLAAEVISVDMAREQAEKRETARVTAALELAKQRQQTQADLAKSTLTWMQGTERRADGRRERKDSFEAASKLVTDMGKAEVALPDIKTEAAPRPQSHPLGPWLAAKFGYDKMTMQAAPLLLISLVMLVFSVVFWPLSSWFWSRAKQPTPETGPPPREVPAQGLPPEAAQPAALGSDTAPKSLPAPVLQSADVGQPEPEPPRPVHPGKTPAPVARPRQPVSAAARTALDAIDYPWIKPVGPTLETCLDVAKFAIWLRCFGLHGPYDVREIYDLYREAAREFHCEHFSYNTLANSLDNRRLGVVKTRPDGGPIAWVISPFRPKRATSEPDEPEQRLGHLAPSKQAEAIADSAPVEEGRTVIRRPFGVAPSSVRAGGRMRPDRDDLAWLHLNAKAMRRARLAQCRRQRGARAGRRAAA